MGDEGGFAPNFPDELAPFEILKKVIDEEGLSDKFDLGMDAAASNVDVSSQELIKTYEEIKRSLMFCILKIFSGKRILKTFQN